LGEARSCLALQPARKDVTERMCLPVATLTLPNAWAWHPQLATMTFWEWSVQALSLLAVLAALLASGHAVVYKREPRSAALWILVIWLVPTLGPLLYLMLGINRVRRRAAALREDMVKHRTTPDEPIQPLDVIQCTSPTQPPLVTLANLVEQVVQRPLLGGNRIEPLVNGVEAFPAMLKAIESARHSVAMASYIFDGGGIGTQFVHALSCAHDRGVDVRVLIDDVYVRFAGGASAVKPLRQRGVAVEIFNPPVIPARLHAAHLRNHRKLLVVDGHTGFTGGLNVYGPYWRPDAPREAQRDLHFRIRGAVTSHLAEVFADDWHFTTGEALRGEKWFPPLEACGDVAARGLEAGPDESLDRLRWVFIGGVNAAQHSVRVWTPYFMPDTALIAALNAAALRGVEVDILIPTRGDHRLVQWAATAQLWQVLEHGCRVWMNPEPFDHSKLLLVDGAWSTFGSANWDARSLRLNFEFNVECYSSQLGGQLEQLFLEKRAAAKPLTLEAVNSRSLTIKLRDGIARLFAPYL
jgi:cardiolipin synthase